MNLLDVQDKIKAGEYRSDRFPAVPFVTFDDVLKTSKPEAKTVVTAEYPECGASLTVGNSTHVCGKRLGHVSQGSTHDWVGWL